MKIRVEMGTQRDANNRISFCGKNNAKWIAELANEIWECIQIYYREYRKVKYICKITQWTVFLTTNYSVLIDCLYEKKTVCYTDGSQKTKYERRADGVERVIALLKSNNLLVEIKES